MFENLKSTNVKEWASKRPKAKDYSNNDLVKKLPIKKNEKKKSSCKKLLLTWPPRFLIFKNTLLSLSPLVFIADIGGNRSKIEEECLPNQFLHLDKGSTTLLKITH